MAAKMIAGSVSGTKQLVGLLPKRTADHDISSTLRGRLKRHRPSVIVTPELRRHVTTSVAATDYAPTAAAAGAPRPTDTFEFACPICLDTKFEIQPSQQYPRCTCPRCQRTFEPGGGSGSFLDLTVTSGLKPRVYQQKFWTGTELFRQPLISTVYERGWRQSFAWAGFPGADKEYDMAMQYLSPAYGGTLLDVSCGTGLFSRRFAKSNRFAGVVASDFSESMLEQTRTFVEQDRDMSLGSPLVLLRADVGRLPFATGSVDAIHAGAAMHCWPNPQAAMAEVSRVLRPGGVYVASTFLSPVAPLGQLVGDNVVRPLNQLQQRQQRSMYKFWEEGELEDLAASVGLQGYTRTRNWRFIMFSVTKPLEG